MDEQSIFLEALQKETPEERAAFLAKACGNDEDVRHEVEMLLKAHEKVGDFLQRAPADTEPIDQPITEKPGTNIGPYKLLQKIGEGGMGVVYMAEQKEPVKRRVALKIIKPGMDTRQVIARFEAERQALAMMDHPNIAKVLDAGATESGRPYFVMELVNGTPVTDYCDEQHLTPKERLELFVPICQAVQHAHQKGIIHRDLKPSNILVALYDGQAVPKVIDFGVAKATSQTLTEKTLFTQFGQIIGTLEYMSPEQAERNQLDIDTRSDVYSLGVVLYELLVGETPFDRKRMRSAALHEMLRILREEDPPKPSTKLSGSQSLPSIAANRRIEPARLSSTIRGDLDWIVMKALEKDRIRRYDTASAFSEDIIRFLADEAVSARPPSKLYRFRKFVNRNKASFATAIGVLLALFIGLVGICWQLVRVQHAELAAQSAREVAELERNQAEVARELAAENLVKARAAVSELVAVASKLSDVPESQHIRRDLVDSALDYYEGFLRSNQDNSEMRADVASTHLHVGHLKAQLGDFREALVSYERATSSLSTVRQDPLQHARFQRILANVYHAQGWARLQLGEVETAITSYNKAVENRSELVDELAQEGDRLDLASAYHNLAIALLASGDVTQASDVAEKSLKMSQQLLETQPSSYAYRTRVARISGFLGALKAQSGQWTEARPHMRVCAELHEQLVKDHPNDRDCRRRVAVAADWLAQSALHDQDYESALEHANRAIQVGEDLAQSFPTRYRFRAELADHYLTLASVFESMGQRTQTHDAYRSAIDSYQILAKENASYTGLMRALGRYGANCLKHKEFKEAVTVLRDLLELTVEADVPGESQAMAKSMLGTALARRGLELLETDVELAHRNLNQGVTYLAHAYSELNKYEKPLSDSSRKQIVDILETLVEVYTDWNRQDDAEKWREELRSVKRQQDDLPRANE